ncbi:hypothetical protein [Arsenophonus apicola]|uniref:hypothetical protein n=1 Tax=Arsenophonus apicola TaxID=2879119 RepID=UPI0038793730
MRLKIRSGGISQLIAALKNNLTLNKQHVIQQNRRFIFLPTTPVCLFLQGSVPR